MNDTVKGAIVVIVASVGSLIWGVQYRSNHPLSAMAGFFGTSDPKYEYAGWAVGIGALAFLVGIALLIGGLAQGNAGRRQQRARTTPDARRTGEDRDETT
jgi:hypothetical protein